MTVNWFKIIMDLKARNWSCERISKYLNTSPNTVRNWRDGTEPRFSDGIKLIFLWKSVLINKESTRWAEKTQDIADVISA